MKKATLKLRALFAVVAVAVLFVTTLNYAGVKHAGAETTKNQSIVLDTSYYTRVTAPLNYNASPKVNYNGAGISFDVLSSDLKSQKNLTTLKNADSLVGEMTRYNPYPGVAFAFWADELDFGADIHGLYGLTTSNKANSFMVYFADGRIGMHIQNDARLLHLISDFDGEGNLEWKDPYGLNANATYMSMPCGDLNELKNFLNPGYSYKVEMDRGNVEYEEGEFTITKGKIDGRNNPWYIAYKKALDSTEWQPIFAIPLPRGYEEICPIDENHCYAGFEVQANSYCGAYQGTVGSYSASANNVKMELDNVRIENYGSEQNKVVNESNFDTITAADFNYDDESDVKSCDHANWDTCTSNYNAYYSQNSTTVGTLTITSINAPKEAIAANAKRKLKVVIDATTAKNQTIVLDSSYYTRVTAPINYESSPLVNYNGASISFDVLSSDLKSQKNLTTMKNADSLVGEMTRYNPYPGVAFAFWADELDFGADIYGVYGNTAGNKANAFMTYFADGRIGIHIQSDTRMLHLVSDYDGEGNLEWKDPYGLNANATYMSMPCGDLNELKNFLNPGYSYKVEMVRGNVEYEDGEFTITKGKIDGRNNPWYIAYKKALYATEWQPIFAIPIPRGYEKLCPIDEDHCYAGFEVQANSYCGAYQGTVDSYSANANNVKMELDNVRIENYGSEENVVVNESNFDTISEEDFNYDNESDVKSCGHANWDTCTQKYSDYYTQNSITIGTLTITSINAPKEAMGSYSKRSLNTYAYVDDLKATYTEANEKVTMTDKYSADSLSALQTAINAVDMSALMLLPIEDQDSVDTATASLRNEIDALVLNQLTVTFVVDGETYDTVTVNYGETATLSKDYPTKTGYTFFGWDDLLENITEDKTINAVWEINTYTVTFVVDGETYDAVTVNYGETAVLSEAEPTKTGYTFNGWDGSLENISDNMTVNAVWQAYTYTVTFVVDGETYDTVTVNYGETAALSKVAPTKAGYTFNGWDGSLENVTENKTVNAQFVKDSESSTHETSEPSESSSASSSAGCGSAINGGLIEALMLVLGAAFIVVKARRKED